jgi:hypothetical protein
MKASQIFLSSYGCKSSHNMHIWPMGFDELTIAFLQTRRRLRVWRFFVGL